MADITLPRPARAGVPMTPYLVALALALVAAFLLALGWSAVLSRVEQRCEVRGGAFSSGFSVDFDIQRCECKTPSMNFSDPCNSQYLGAI